MVEFKKAKTMPKSPHEYIIRAWDKDLFAHYEKLIREKGVREKYGIDDRIMTNKYYYEGDYKYWIIKNVLNRCRIDDLIYDEELGIWFSKVSYEESKKLIKEKLKNKNNNKDS